MARSAAHRPRDIDETILAQFVAQLKRPHAPGRSRDRLPGFASGVRKFATRLWSAGSATRRSAPPATATEQWLRAIDEYLARGGSASVGTLRIYLSYTRTFVTARFGLATPSGRS